MTNIKLQNKDLKDEWEDTGITFHGSYTQAEQRLSELLKSGDLLMGDYRLVKE